jgi:quercetin dioxygenase-like cupin family protein
MQRTNLFDTPRQWDGMPDNGSIYDSPSLKILTCRIDPGQSLLMRSDEMRGKVSLVVIEGYGEWVVDEAGRHLIQAGDIVISEFSESHRLLALTDLRLLVTIASSDCSCATAGQF